MENRENSLVGGDSVGRRECEESYYMLAIIILKKISTYSSVYSVEIIQFTFFLLLIFGFFFIKFLFLLYFTLQYCIGFAIY